MAKTTYEYKLVKVPVEVADKVDSLFNQAKGEGKKIRKADLWVKAVKGLRV